MKCTTCSCLHVHVVSHTERYFTSCGFALMKKKNLHVMHNQTTLSHFYQQIKVLYFRQFCAVNNDYHFISDASQKVKSLLTSEMINDVCLMERLGRQCCKTHRKCLHWVKCDKCHAWYHCVCIGISECFFDDAEKGFICCESPSPNNM